MRTTRQGAGRGCHRALYAVGTILAVYGCEQDDGKFLVEDHCFANLPPPLPCNGPSADR